MDIILDDSNGHLVFAPLTLSRPVGDLRMGIFTNVERFSILISQAVVAFQTEKYLERKFNTVASFQDDQKQVINFNARFILNEILALEILAAQPSFKIVGENGEVIARRGNDGIDQVSKSKAIYLQHRWDLFSKNAEVLESDFQIATKHFQKGSLSSSNTVIGDVSKIFIAEGAKVEASIFNTNSGSVFIGPNAEIMEGCMVRGGLALCNGAVLKMGAKVYGASTFGPNCRIGGEVSNSIFQGNSNKGHDGFVGNSLLGEWVNLGADTNTSNLKNNYGLVSTYSYSNQMESKTSEQFMGITIGDHSKSGINTMFNTASVVGFSSNIYGGNFPQKFIDSFQWGGSEGFVPFQKDKAIEVAKNMMGRRNVQFTEGDQVIFDHLYDRSSQ
jgi:UDP-N-acetylglucosamine diphosphorylase/glucosamine-1-phosphate N-acetyltransferase